ncbi:MAG: FkbM family methyltransferase, partial [Aggregatilineales bacterium]
FEPNPVLVRGVEQRFATNDRMHIYQKALGSRDEPVEFNVLNYAPSSSILAPDAINHKYHGDKMDIAQKIQVDMCRLDSVIDTDIDIYKLDLQGYELAALEGSVALLPRTKIILTEIEFASLYQSQPLFGDIDVFLRAQGFFLFNLYDLFTHPDGQLTAGDAMYLNSRFYKQ